MSTSAPTGSWRAGATPPAAPTPEQDAAAQAAAAEAAKAEAAESPQSILRDDRMHDLYWTHSPTDNVWVIISRREKKKKARSRMPVILRNLAPDSVFDPREAWSKEKAQQAEIQAVADAEVKAAKAADGKKAKKEKEKKLSKADEIRLKNDESQRAKEVRNFFALAKRNTVVCECVLRQWLSKRS